MLTQPDRPRGRGLRAGAVAGQAAGARNAASPCCSRRRCATRGARAPLVARRRSTCSWWPPTDSSCRRPILAWPRHGCLNVHASLLPRWRGAAPIQRALLAGDAETGVTIMQMDAGLDTGPMLDVVGSRSARATRPATLHERARGRGRARARRRAASPRGGDAGVPNAAAGRRASPTRRRSSKAEAAIDWARRRRGDRSAGPRVRPGARCAHDARRRSGEGVACRRSPRRERRLRPPGNGARGGSAAASSSPAATARCASSSCSPPAAGA